MGRGHIRFRPDQVAVALGLPQGLTVVGVHTTFDPPALVVIVEGPGLPETPDDAESWPLEFVPQRTEIISNGLMTRMQIEAPRLRLDGRAV